jgi:hypothetical protein
MLPNRKRSGAFDDGDDPFFVYARHPGIQLDAIAMLEDLGMRGAAA